MIRQNSDGRTRGGKKELKWKLVRKRGTHRKLMRKRGTDNLITLRMHLVHGIRNGKKMEIEVNHDNMWKRGIKSKGRILF